MAGKPGRKPLFGKAMTALERQHRHRRKVRQARADIWAAFWTDYHRSGQERRLRGKDARGPAIGLS